MLASTTSTIDLICELQLRHWARTNYVPEESRAADWHPVVLDEMRRRDEELLSIAELICNGDRVGQN